MHRAITLAAAALLAAAPCAAQTPAPGSADFDAYVTQTMRDWKVPGVAIAVVRDDAVVFARGYGVREMGKPDSVTPNTLFAIGSATKAFTATLVAMLVSEGKLRWDDPVIRYLPWFQLSDPYITRELTLRDVLAHRSGLGRSGDLLWYATTMPRDTILSRLRFIDKRWRFRASFEYSNLGYLTAGEVAAHAAGKSWDDLLRERIFTPLGMTSTSTSISALRGAGDVASNHIDIHDTLQVVPYRNLDNIGPAGSINSNVLDLAKWIRFQLDSGRVGGRALVDASTLDETHQQQMPLSRITLERRYPAAHSISYGMGWFLSDYRDHKLVEHSGAIEGMTGEVALLPEERLGVVVLTNAATLDVSYALMFRALDGYLREQPRDWSGEWLARRNEQRRRSAERSAKASAAPQVATSPSLALARYAGTYSDSAFGEADVTLENGRLVLRYGVMTADLEHWRYDTFRAIWRQWHGITGFVDFSLNHDGDVSRMKVEQFADFVRVATQKKGP